jgi:hypothetical protein
MGKMMKLALNMISHSSSSDMGDLQRKLQKAVDADMDEWNAIADELNAYLQQPTSDEVLKLMKRAVSVPKPLYNKMEKKLGKRASMTITFTGNKFKTIIKRNDGKLWAFDPDHPEGREIMTLEAVQKVAGRKIATMKGFLLMKAMDAGMTETDASSLAHKMSVNPDKLPVGLAIINMHWICDMEGVS